MSHLHLVHAEVVSVTSSIRKYSRANGGASGSGSSGSASTSSIGPLSSRLASGYGIPGTPHYAAVPSGSHAASLTGGVIAQATRRASHGTEEDGGGLKSALSARARAKQADEDSAATTSNTPSAASLEPYALLHAFTLLRAQLRDHQRTQGDADSLSSFPLPLLVAPFLHVVLSPRVSAPVTSAALQSINRLLVYGVISVRDHSSRLAIADVARAVSLCKFEPSEPAVDELVLLRILAVMKQIVCGHDGASPSSSSLADVLPDESICQMMETGLSMCCQVRLTDLLRKTAEQNLLPMVRHIFARLPQVPLSSDDAYSSDFQVPPDHTSLAAQDVEEVMSETGNDEKRLRRMTMPDPTGLGLNAVEHVVDDDEDIKSAGQPEGQQQQQQDGQQQDGDDGERGKDDSAATPVEAPQPTLPSYSLPAIKEILRVLISLLDPQSTSHTDSMRLLGLNLLTAVFETAGTELTRLPSLRAQVQDTGCKYLFQLARSESFAISSYANRAICTMFEGAKEDLKLQYEMLLTFLFDRLAPTYPIGQEPWTEGASVPKRSLTDGSAPPPAPPPPPPMPKSSDKAPALGDARDLSLETLAMLLGAYKADAQDASSSDALLELFVNYDCDVDCDDLFARAVHFLCRAVFAGPRPPTGVNGAPTTGNANIAAAGQDATQVFALDAILAFVERLTIRQQDGDGDDDEAEEAQGDSTPWPSDFPTAESLEESRGRKDAVLEGARRFNAKPREGLAYLEQQGFISADPDRRARSIASFLLSCPRLDKKLLGDYLSRPANEDILLAFISLFDFADKPLSEAMREMLESFRLPGESQQIARITETFSKVYFAAVDKNVIKSEDAVYVLAYSVIMLNTDLHNAQNKRKMKVEDYRRNLRGVNDGTDFDQDYLGNIYENIRKREIVMPEEHLGQLGFDYAWKELLRKSRTSTKLRCPPTGRFDRAMFEVSWKPVVACIAHAFSTFRDEHLLERAISGFRQCAMLASKWGMDDVFDFMIQGLASSTGLLDAGGVLPLPGAPPQGAVVEVEGSKVTVSSLSVRFGLDFKGQLAAVVLFTIANGNGQAIREGWTPIFEIFKNLFAAGLLPNEMASMYDPVDDASDPATESPSTKSVTAPGDSGSGANTPRASTTPTPRHLVPIPLKPKKKAGAPTPDPRTASGGGLFSTLSSYLLSPYSNAAEPAAPEVTHEDVESSLCTVDCIASCRLGELYSQLLALDNHESLLTAVRSLRQLADRLTLGQLAAAAASQQYDGLTSGGERSSTPTQGQQSSSRAVSGSGVGGTADGPGGASHQRLAYDPRSVFVLELLTNVTCAAQATPEAWSEAYAHIASLLQSPRNFHTALLERAVVCLLRLIDDAGSGDETTSRIDSAIDLLRFLPADIKPILSPSIIASLQHVLSKPRAAPFVHSSEHWTNLLSIAQESLSTRTAQSIALLYSLVSTISSFHLSSANFIPVVQILRDIAQCADPEPMLVEINKRERQGYRLTLTEKKELTEYVEMCRVKGVEAVRRIEECSLRVNEVGAGDGAIQTQLYLTLTSALSTQSLNAHRATRQASLTSLSRVLFSSSSSSWTPMTSPRQLFTTTLFPLLDTLCNPTLFPRETDSKAPGGLIETRTKASNVLCNTLCSYTTTPEETTETWKVSLDLLDRLAIAQPHSEQLKESIKENLRKVLLVFAANGLLVADGVQRTPSQVALWVLTTDRLDKSFPGLVQDALGASPDADGGGENLGGEGQEQTQEQTDEQSVSG